MGDFTNGETPEKIAAGDSDVVDNIGKVETDVEGCFADGGDKVNGLPIFNVSKNDFYQNMRTNRKRLRFQSGSQVQKYMQQTKYNRAFFVRHNNLLRKIK